MYVCTVLCSVMSSSSRHHGLQPARLLCPWGLSRQEYWSGLPCPPPGDLPNPGIEPASLESPASAGGFFTTSVTWEAHCVAQGTNYIQYLIIYSGKKIQKSILIPISI